MNKPIMFRNLFLVTTAAKTSVSRRIHIQNITDSINYFTNKTTQITVDPKSMKINKETDKPVCIMMNWLGEPWKLKLKYASLYLDEGFEVISVSIRPLQLMWPKKGSQIIGQDVLKIMTANDFKYVVHGFSVGGYVWSEALVHAARNLDKYQPVLDRVSAQVWDSLTDYTAASYGIPIALFPDKPIVQKSIEVILRFYLYAFWNISTKHYSFGSETFRATPCRAPALLLASSSDTVGHEEHIRAVYDQWLDMGIQCTWQCWERAPHVKLYTTHSEEYLRLLRTHIRHNLPQYFPKPAVADLP